MTEYKINIENIGEVTVQVYPHASVPNSVDVELDKLHLGVIGLFTHPHVITADGHRIGAGDTLVDCLHTLVGYAHSLGVLSADLN